MDIKAWKDSVASLLKESAFAVQQLLPDSVYGYLCSAAVLPVITAIGQEDMTTYGTVANLAGSLGVNLISNRIESWRDHRGMGISPELTEELAARAASDMEVRGMLDDLLQKLEVPQTIGSILSNIDEAAREEFTEALRSELTQSQSRDPAEADRAVALLLGSGAMVSGRNNIGAGERGIAAGSISGGIVSTGDKNENRLVHAEIYNEQHFHGDQSHPHGVPASSHKAASKKAQIHYLKQLHQRCHVLPLADMGGEEGACQEVTLDKVYIDLDTRTQVPLSEAEKAELKNKREPSGHARPDGGETRPLTVLEAAGAHHRLVLLGDPGSGKSTFVRQLCALLAGADLSGHRVPPDLKTDIMPVFTNLRDVASRLAGLSDRNLSEMSEAERDRCLVDAVWEQWKLDLKNLKADNFEDGLEEVLSEGKVLLVFDGMDEVPEAMRPRIRESLVALLRLYPSIARMIVTCRIRSYTGSAVLHGFHSHTLAPFDEQKIGQFVGAWYRAQAGLHRMDESTAEAKADNLRTAALSENLGELASNPMLLTTMALIHQREVELPRQRVRLYSLAVQVLLGRWQKRKGITVSERLQSVLADDLKLRAIMERVAYEAHDRKQDREAELSRGDLLALLEKEEYLKEAGPASDFLDYVDQRAGILVGHGGGGDSRHPQSYSFPHRTFQEYLAGCHLLSGRGIERTYWKLLPHGDYWYMAGQLGAEELLFNKSTPPLLLDLMYGLCPSHPPELDTQWRAVVWSGQMATLMERSDIERDTEKHGGGIEYLERLIPRMVDVLRESPLNAIERAEAGRILARLGDPRRAVTTVEGMEFRLVPAGPFMMGGGGESDSGEKARPLRRVDIPYDYLLSRYPVTNAQFREFVEAGGYKNRQYWKEAEEHGYWKDGKMEGRFDSAGRDTPYAYGEPYNLSNHPVVGVTWYEALAYTRWVTERLRACNKIPVEWKIRLPNEYEWEKAARGGIQISDGSADDPGTLRLSENPNPARIYPWGDSPPDAEKANYKETVINTTSAVGCFPGGGSPYEVEEMAGNVWEWSMSLWSEDSAKIKAGGGSEDLNAHVTTSRVLRGGAFYADIDALGCGFRDGNDPNDWIRNYGFRIVASHLTSEL